MKVLFVAAASCVLALPALAQTGAQGTMGQGASGQQAGSLQMQGNASFITRREPGVWRASELIGKDVYGANNEDMGEVGDVLLDRNGQVRAVVLDVGGFLGIGETQIAVPMNALQFRSEDNRAATAGTTGSTAGTAGSTAGTTGTSAGTGAGAGGSTGRTAGTGEGMPDRIILLVTRDQLRSAPKFEDGKRSAMGGNRNTTAPANTTTGTGTAPRQ